jgi:ribosomal protein S18 acetylase RimI-like enzyme
MQTVKRPGTLSPRYTADAAEYLDHAGAFLRRRPVEHSVLLSTATSHLGKGASGEVPDLWLWVEDEDEVVAAAQHTPPFGAYLSTGPAESRPATPASPAMRLGLYTADAVRIPPNVTGRLRPATEDDVSLLRVWANEFFAEAGTKSVSKDEVRSRVDAGLLVVWEVDGAVVSMAAVTVAQGGVSRIQLVYTPPEHRKCGFASACVASLTARELATPGRSCMLNTDLANPTSNGIYQAIGYRRVGEAVELRFDTPSPGRE